MKKKEILIIVIISVVMVCLTAALFSNSYYWDNFSKKTGGKVTDYGFPFNFWVVNYWPLSVKNFLFQNLILDFLFWFAIIFSLWQLIKWIRGAINKKFSRLLVVLFILVVSASIFWTWQKDFFKSGREETKISYSTESVAKKLQVPVSYISVFENEILEQTFENYQFFKVVRKPKELPTQEAIVAIDSTGAILRDFNLLLTDAKIIVRSKNKAKQVSQAFITFHRPDNLGGFKFLKSASEIPYQEKDFKNPLVYAKEIEPPGVEKKDNSFVTTQYSWCRGGGALIGWQVRIDNNKVSLLSGEVIDVGLGSFQPHTEGILHIPGYKIFEKII